MKQTTYSNLTDNKLQVEREFDGTIEQVWKAWTDSKILEQWWAPLPFKAITHQMDFREGGSWHYYMLGPDGSKFWCMAGYQIIEPLKRFTGDDYFCDENGNRNNELPGMLWDVAFAPAGKGTKVTVTITYASKKDMETIISMGFKEGFSAAHENLDKLLEQ
jgi:uncharacterized protein YndB with AHSA1/START domain